MGLTEVTLKTRSIDKPEKVATGNFLVDSGAAYTVLPQQMVKKLDLKPSFEKEFVLADGTMVKRKIGSAIINYEGIEIASPVVLGEKEDAALLGVITLEGMGLVLNPFERKLHPARLLL
ncbi:MAG: aspartyl protease family protein [Candidatus Blackburnbacteria bacterium]|nr:aspartyl protease family protein [Candidatus Blackburnbacteria bacterium]